jgi:hypothetical protein
MSDIDINRFIDEQRIVCLWYMREDYYPSTKKEKISVLRKIQSHGNLEAFKKAGEIICQLQNSKK